MKILVNTVLAISVIGYATWANAQSLYDDGTFRAIASDHRAFRVGDNLTIVITEFASMTTSARTTTDKDGSASAEWNNTNSSRNAGVSASEDFSGGGKIERSGKLVAQLTVVVQSVDKNGDLWVKGVQELEVNNEKQKLSIEGRVKPRDVGADNSVLSTRLSDAKIGYTGKGLLAEKQQPGVLSRFLSWIGLL